MNRIFTFCFCLFCGVALGQVTIAEQDFDGVNSWTYTTTPAPYNVSGDVWGIVSSLPNITLTQNFWGMQDLNNPNGGGGFDHILSFNPIDVTANGELELTFDFDVEAYDSPDDIEYILVIDGVDQAAVSLKGTTGTNQGTINESILSSVNSVAIKIVANQDGGSDYAGVDNFKLVEIPACDLSLMTGTAVCDANTAGTDTYTFTVPFSGGATDTYTITPSAGAVSGDDPNSISMGIHWERSRFYRWLCAT